MEWLFWIGGAMHLVVVMTMTADLTFLMIAGGAPRHAPQREGWAAHLNRPILPAVPLC